MTIAAIYCIITEDNKQTDIAADRGVLPDRALFGFSERRHGKMADIFDLFRQISGKREETALTAIAWLIVGLGNPGDEYRSTRHNAGFMTVDEIGRDVGARVDRAKFHALTGETVIGGVRVLLMKPMTMMNASGVAVGEAAKFYKLPPERVLVFSDDITLAPGRLRVRAHGSAGGHNGLKSIIEHLGSENFPRIRLGVGEKPRPEMDLADWVLSDFTAPEKLSLHSAALCAEEGLKLILSGDFDRAVQLCNSHR